MRRAVALALGASLFVGAGDASAAGAVQAKARVSPGPHLFGDQVNFVVDALVDSKVVDPSSVRVEVSLLPYEPSRKPSRRQIADGDLVRVTYRYSVACLSLDCLPTTEGKILKEKRITFPDGEATYVDRSRTHHALDIAMPAVRLIARAPPDPEAERLRAAGFLNRRDPIADLRAPTRTLHTSYWTSPALVGSVFLGSAVLVFAAALVLGWPALLRAYGVLRPVMAAPSLTPLEEALTRVDEAAETGPGTAAHREALARLMRELRAGGFDDLVEPARRLAWSAESPAADSSRELSRRVRQAMAVKS